MYKNLKFLQDLTELHGQGLTTKQISMKLGVHTCTVSRNLKKMNLTAHTTVNFWTLDQCKSAASKCKTRSEFAERFHLQYSKARKMRWLDEICSHMDVKKHKWTFEECELAARKCSTRNEFCLKYNREYVCAVKRGWLDQLCKHMLVMRRQWTKQLCHELAKQYNIRNEFRKYHRNAYAFAYKRGWLDEICEHMGRRKVWGFSSKYFIECCNRNNNGKGILYLIKCTGNGESFYKFGITSLSVEERYGPVEAPRNAEMPYSYEIVWQIEGDAKIIYETESTLNNLSNPYRYHPVLWKSKSRETFKCHGNCKILQKPALDSF